VVAIAFLLQILLSYFFDIFFVQILNNIYQMEDERTPLQPKIEKNDIRHDSWRWYISIPCGLIVICTLVALVHSTDRVPLDSELYTLIKLKDKSRVNFKSIELNKYVRVNTSNTKQGT
jgi:hypothetical protein